MKYVEKSYFVRLQRGHRVRLYLNDAYKDGTVVRGCTRKKSALILWDDSNVEEEIAAPRLIKLFKEVE